MSEIYVSEEIYTTAPTDEGRLPKEMAVYELLDKLNIPYERIDHDAADTMEACELVDDKLDNIYNIYSVCYIVKIRFDFIIFRDIIYMSVTINICISTPKDGFDKIIYFVYIWLNF